MNTPPHRRHPGGFLVSWSVGLLIAAICLLVATGCAELVVDRAIPWGQHVELEIWASLAAPLPIEEAMGHLITAETASVPTWWQLAIARLLGCLRWAQQVEISLRTDHAAVVTEERTVTAFLVPHELAAAGGGLPITITSLGDAGAVSLMVAGGRHLELTSGASADLALSPASGIVGWVAVEGDWRSTIETRLAAGQAVGRLTVVNLGLRPAGQDRK